MEREQLKLMAAGVIVGLAAGFLIARAVYIENVQGATMSPNVIGPAAPSQMPPSGAQQGMPAFSPDQEALHQEIQGLLEHIALHPEDRNARVRLGNITFDNGLFQAAAKYYEEALDLDPNDPNVITDLGVSYRNLGDGQKAIEMFEDAVKLQPDHVKGWYNIAVVALFDLNDTERARAALKKAVEVDPTFAPAQELMQQVTSATTPPAASDAAPSAPPDATPPTSHQ